MISSQGASAVLPNGMIVKQTIGQQSVSGTAKGEFTIQQGFQQNHWARMVAKAPVRSDITVTAYPNPFISEVNFQFSKVISEAVSIAIFDVGGRLVFQQNQKVIDGILRLDLSRLTGSIYLVRVNNNEFNYYIKIAKSL
jgi:hypothetical protein